MIKFPFPFNLLQIIQNIWYSLTGRSFLLTFRALKTGQQLLLSKTIFIIHSNKLASILSSIKGKKCENIFQKYHNVVFYQIRVSEYLFRIICNSHLLPLELNRGLENGSHIGCSRKIALQR